MSYTGAMSSGSPTALLRPSYGEYADVELVQVRSLMELVGMPELAQAIALYKAGRPEDAARYARAAGPRGPRSSNGLSLKSAAFARGVVDYQRHSTY
jgi:hypothetical protein